MRTILALALALAPRVGAVGVPTDASVHTFADGLPDDNLDVVGRVLKFMDPTRTADPQEILRQLGVPPRPAPERRRLDEESTYEPTSLTPAPTTVTYEPTTETYAPTGGFAIVKFNLGVTAPSENDLIDAIPIYKATIALELGVPEDSITITVVPATPLTRKLAEATQGGGRQLQEGSLFTYLVEIGLGRAQAQQVVDLVEGLLPGDFVPPPDLVPPDQQDLVESIEVTSVDGATAEKDQEKDDQTPSETRKPTLGPTAMPSGSPTRAPVKPQPAPPKPSEAPSQGPTPPPVDPQAVTEAPTTSATSDQPTMAPI